jgi:hypothetical protein
MKVKTPLVTKLEALEQINKFINQPGTIDLEPFIELLTWQSKLTLWLLKEGKQREQKQEMLDKVGELIAETESELALLEYARKH